MTADFEKKPIIVEQYADNGEFSHWHLIDPQTGEVLWSSFPEETKARGENIEIDKYSWNVAVDTCAKSAQLDMGEKGKAKEYLATDELLYEFGITVDCESILKNKLP